MKFTSQEKKICFNLERKTLGRKLNIVNYGENLGFETVLNFGMYNDPDITHVFKRMLPAGITEKSYDFTMLGTNAKIDLAISEENGHIELSIRDINALFAVYQSKTKIEIDKENVFLMLNFDYMELDFEDGGFLERFGYSACDFCKPILQVLEKYWPEEADVSQVVKNVADNFAVSLKKLHPIDEKSYKNRIIIALNLLKRTNEIEHASGSNWKFNKSKCLKGKNVVYYGVPGCGKSYSVKLNYKEEDSNGNLDRITFHPEYSYGDFVGQVMPVVDRETRNIKYEFVPGAFTRILKKALEDLGNHYVLVIEEINRGNAPAVFGDVFQLLDREENHLESEYSIKNVDISEYLGKKENYHIKIPGNLSIIGTMNTSDQNVFTLDTAFKRRFLFKRIKNSFTAEHHYKNKYVPGTTCTWENFVTVINRSIVRSSSLGLNSEDKQIGIYFIDSQSLSSPKDKMPENIKEKFAEKVLMYLWEDVFKYNRDDVFLDDYNTLDSLINGFKSKGLEIFKFCEDFLGN